MFFRIYLYGTFVDFRPSFSYRRPCGIVIFLIAQSDGKSKFNFLLSMLYMLSKGIYCGWKLVKIFSHKFERFISGCITDG